METLNIFIVSIVYLILIQFMEQHILTKAEDLFLKYGTKSVSMDDISRKLGISKKTIYQYVDTKKNLVHRIVENHIENEKIDIDKINEEAKNAIEATLQMAKYIIQHLKKIGPSIVYDLQKYHKSSWNTIEEFHQTYVKNCIETNLTRGIKEGYYRKEIDVDIISKLYVGKTLFVSDEDAFPSKEYSKDRVFKEFILYHLHGVVSDKGLEYLKNNEQFLNSI